MESTTGLVSVTSALVKVNDSDDHYSSTWNGTTSGAMVDLNATSTDDYLNYTNFSIIGLICFGLICFVTVLGLFGNILILAVTFRSRAEAFKGHDVLITALALFDGIALVSTAVSLPSTIDIIGMDMRAISTTGCKVFMGVFQPSAISSFSIIVLICIERFIAVWFPFRAKQLLSPKIIYRCLGIVVGIVFIVYATMAILNSETDDGICDPNFDGKLHSTVLNQKPNIGFYLPMLGTQLITYFAILLILTPLILIKLYLQRVRRRQLNAALQDNATFQITVKLTSVVIAFLIFVALPNGFTVPMGLGDRKQLINSDNRGNPKQLISLLFLLNYSINFLLYIVFDPQFRTKALEIIGFVRVARPDRSVSINTLTTQSV